MNMNENPNHEDLLERATEAMRQTSIPEGPTGDLVTDVVAALEREEVACNVQPQSLFARINSMKPMTKFVVVATLFVAICSLFTWVSPGGRALAFEEVAKAFASIRSASCSMSTETAGNKEQSIPRMKGESKALFLAPSLERIEMTMKAIDGPVTGEMMSIMICDMRAGKMLSLVPKENTAIVYDTKNAPKDRPKNGSFELLRDRFRRAQADPDKGSRPLGEKEIDGIRAIGFRLDDKTGSTDVWADPETALPIRVETTFVGEPKAEVVMMDFQYNIDLDESLFSFDPPKGYTVRKMTLDLTPPSLKDLGDMLRFAAENSDGAFPEELQGPKSVQGVVGILLKEVAEKHGVNSPEWKDAMLDYASKTARGNAFIMLELPKSEWHYQGAGVKLDNPKTAIFWFKPQNADTFQVLYGDLRVEKGVKEADLPQD